MTDARSSASTTEIKQAREQTPASKKLSEEALANDHRKGVIGRERRSAIPTRPAP
jgi:hypothetical protein